MAVTGLCRFKHLKYVSGAGPGGSQRTLKMKKKKKTGFLAFKIPSITNLSRSFYSTPPTEGYQMPVLRLAELLFRTLPPTATVADPVPVAAVHSICCRSGLCSPPPPPHLPARAVSATGALLGRRHSGAKFSEAAQILHLLYSSATTTPPPVQRGATKANYEVQCLNPLARSKIHHPPNNPLPRIRWQRQSLPTVPVGVQSPPQQFQWLCQSHLQPY